LKDIRLQHIYNDEKEELFANFADIKKILDNRQFKYEVLIGFWTSVHLEKLAFA